MPIPQIIRINPLDLQKNTAIGISLPFGSQTNNKLFNLTYSTKEQIKSNLINLLLTSKGERVLNPLFGCDLKKTLFENINPINDNNIRDIIISSTNIYTPEITISNISINNLPDENLVNITIDYILNISGNPDQITIQFQ